MIIWNIIILLGVNLLKVNCQDIVPRFPISYTNSKNVGCRKDSLLLEKGLKEEILWAMQMWDSSVKSGVGIVSGTLLQYGDFDECLSVKEPIMAKYCLLTVTLLKPTSYNSTDPFTIDYNPSVPVWEKLNDRGVVSKQKNNVVNWAICVPSSCQENEMLESLNGYITNKNLTTEITLTFTTDACTRIDDNQFTFGDYVFCFGVGVYLLFLIIISVHDYLYIETIREKPDNILQCFSLRRSLYSLAKPYPPINGYNMNVLRGFHIFPIIFITLGHRYSMFVIGGMSNYHFVEKTFKYTEFSMWSSRISLTVDCFFTISGFMVGALLPFYYANKQTTIVDVILNRYIRLVPSFLFVILFHATILDKTGDGPIWNAIIRPEKQFCVENWWINLLFIGNYINSDRNCILQSWYIYCDIQLFVITAIIFYIAKGHPAIIKCLITALIIVTIGGSFYAVYSWNFTAFILHYKRVMDNIRSDDYFNRFYTKTHFRAPPYLFGVIIGYIFYLRKPNKISKGETNSLFFGGFLIIFIVYTSGYLFSDPSNYRYGFPAALYASLSNVLWAAGLLMMMISLLIGSTSVISKMFSWSFFIPLSKLVYNIYLVHLTLQTHTAASRRTPGYISPMNWFSSTISDLVISTFLALLLYLFIETPFKYLFIYLKNKANKPKEDIGV